MARLTPPQVELLTDIATNPDFYLRRFSRWEKTGRVLVRLKLAEMVGCGPDHLVITITEAGRAEAVRRRLVATPPDGPPTPIGGAG